MVASERVIWAGSRVRLHLQIRLADGTEVLSSFGEDPIELVLGDGTLVCGIEDLLVGLPAGADEQFLLDGSELYGPREESKIHWLPRTDFPTELDLAPGQVIAFEMPGGQEIAGVLLEVEADRARVDLNHPLAGRSLQIRTLVVSVADAETGAAS